MPDPIEVRFVGDLCRIVSGPNDRFVLSIDLPISISQAERIREEWAKFAGGAPLPIVDAGAALEVHVEKAQA